MKIKVDVQAYNSCFVCCFYQSEVLLLSCVLILCHTAALWCICMVVVAHGSSVASGESISYTYLACTCCLVKCIVLYRRWYR